MFHFEISLNLITQYWAWFILYVCIFLQQKNSGYIYVCSVVLRTGISNCNGIAWFVGWCPQGQLYLEFKGVWWVPEFANICRLDLEPVFLPKSKTKISRNNHRQPLGDAAPRVALTEDDVVVGQEEEEHRLTPRKPPLKTQHSWAPLNNLGTLTA